MDLAHEGVHALPGRSRLEIVHLDVGQVEVDGRARRHDLERELLDELGELRLSDDDSETTARYRRCGLLSGSSSSSDDDDDDVNANENMNVRKADGLLPSLRLGQ